MVSVECTSLSYTDAILFEKNAILSNGPLPVFLVACNGYLFGSPGSLIEFFISNGSCFGNPLNPCAQLLQLLIHVFVAAIQVVNAVDLRRPFGGEAGDD